MIWVLNRVLHEKDPKFSLRYFIKAVNEKIFGSQELLAMKYVNENGPENTIKYIQLLINEGQLRVHLNYAITLYKYKMFKHTLFIIKNIEYANRIFHLFLGKNDLTFQ